MKSTVDAANAHIDCIAGSLRFHGNEVEPACVTTTPVLGHTGKGFYAWTPDYPEEGAAFLSTSREAVRVAEFIVAMERKAGCFS